MWDRTNEYKKEIWWNKWLKLFILNWMLKSLRMWDFQASQRHDITLCNSKNVAKRIKKYYWLEAEVVYPNVDVERFNKPSLLAPAELQLQDSRASTPSFTCLPEVEGDLNNPPPARGELEGGILLPKNYYIIISALTEFKKIDVSVNAFNKMPDKNLVVVWTWNFKENLEKMVTWKNIIFTWPKYGDDLVYLLQNAKWLVFSGEEDFWIVPIESFWAWIPVFAYRWWWLAETMIEWVTWEFFDNKTWEDFVEKFEIFEKNINSWKYLGEKIKEHAKNFSEEVFEEKIRAIVWE
jgi:glycosyltransferase involved in cell wall biosynthesis